MLPVLKSSKLQITPHDMNRGTRHKARVFSVDYQDTILNELNTKTLRRILKGFGTLYFLFYYRTFFELSVGVWWIKVQACHLDELVVPDWVVWVGYF